MAAVTVAAPTSTTAPLAFIYRNMPASSAVLISQLPSTVTSDELLALVCQFGDVADHKLIHGGSAIVVFTSPAEAEAGADLLDSYPLGSALLEAHTLPDAVAASLLGGGTAAGVAPAATPLPSSGPPGPSSRESSGVEALEAEMRELQLLLSRQAEAAAQWQGAGHGGGGPQGGAGRRAGERRQPHL